MIQGPQITQQSLRNVGGGNALPPYLQTRTPRGKATPSPVVTPKPTVTPSEVKPQGPAMTPAGAQPPQAGGQSLADVYNYFKSDLENQRKQSLASTRADASARGVFYGTPLTGSEADIETQYLRGLGQLQAGMYGNEQQNQMQRLQLASTLLGMPQSPQAPGVDQNIFSLLGSLFGQSPSVSAPRGGPVQPALTRRGDKITKEQTTN